MTNLLFYFHQNYCFNDYLTTYVIFVVSTIIFDNYIVFLLYFFFSLINKIENN
jgi:hypothetical protein